MITKSQIHSNTEMLEHRTSGQSGSPSLDTLDGQMGTGQGRYGTISFPETHYKSR